MCGIVGICVTPRWQHGQENQESCRCVAHRTRRPPRRRTATSRRGGPSGVTDMSNLFCALPETSVQTRPRVLQRGHRSVGYLRRHGHVRDVLACLGLRPGPPDTSGVIDVQDVRERLNLQPGHGAWDTSGVTTMEGMSARLRPRHPSGTSGVTTMWASSFNQRHGHGSDVLERGF